jgi:hypothetical protein
MSVLSLQGDEVPRKQPVSVRKGEANRQNASKSTGPKTARGKANSRRNAIKHGLFIRVIDETFFNEDPTEFLSFYNRLWDELQPVGPREESEVEYIAISWLRLARLWRYENAELQSGRDSVSRDVEIGHYDPYFEVPGRARLMSLVQNAKSEVETKGQVSPELMQKIFNEDVSIETFWRNYEARAEAVAKKKINEIARKIAEERNIPLNEAKHLLAGGPKLQPEFARFVALETVRSVINQLAQRWGHLSRLIVQNAYQRESIPHDMAVDKLIRYGNTFERHMSRAYYRLERLQSRRTGESVPPPLNIQLTR